MAGHSGRVIQAGYAEHPESGEDLLRLEVDFPYERGGEFNPSTYVWVEKACPVPADGTLVQWDRLHVWIDGKNWHKVEYDSNPSDPLH